MSGEQEAPTPDQVARMEKQLDRTQQLLMLALAAISEADEADAAFVRRREEARRARRRARLVEAIVTVVVVIKLGVIVWLAHDAGWLVP